MSDIDVEELARTLERTANGLDRYINTEASRRAAKLTRDYAKAADERIKDKDLELQKAAERTRQAEADLESVRADFKALMAERNDLDRRLHNVRLCKPWTDDLGRKFVFADELWHASDPEYNPPPAPVRLDTVPSSPSEES